MQRWIRESLGLKALVPRDPPLLHILQSWIPLGLKALSRDCRKWWIEGGFLRPLRPRALNTHLLTPSSRQSYFLQPASVPPGDAGRWDPIVGESVDGKLVS